MSSYHSSFTYMNKNSKEDFNWIISHFDPDNGESETGLSTESVYTPSSDGTYRNLYGTKYSGAEPVRITVIKQDGSDFTINDNREALKWLTGAKTDSWMDLYIGDEVKYRMCGHVQNVLQYKLDARIIGLIIVFESASPWAFSPLQTVSQSILGTETITINNGSDDLYSYVKMNARYENSTGDELIIENSTLGETTQVDNLAVNEVITLDSSMIITSDKTERIFGNDFNFVWPRLAAGENTLVVTGYGNIRFEYTYPIKIGDMATDINAVSDPICNEDGEITIDMLPWSRVSDTPATLSGYGITDTYTKAEIDNKLGNIVSTDVSINEQALNEMLAEVLG